jgi:hypothetical protein
MVVAAVLPVAAMFGAAVAAQGAIRLKLVGVAATPLYTDGAGWAAYEPTAGTTRIIDERTRHSTNRTDPEGCAGGLLALGGGELLYQCAHGSCPRYGCMERTADGGYVDASYAVEDIVGGAVHPVVGANHLPLDESEGPGYTQLSAVGSQWVQGETNSVYSGYRFFLNWHTSELREEGHQPAGGFKTVEDLSSPALAESMCSPLTRTFSLGIHQRLPPTFVYEFPFAVANNEEGEPSLRRCGSLRSQVLPGKQATSLQLGGGLLSWIAVDPSIPNNDDTMYLTPLQPHARDWHGRIYTVRGPEVGAEFMLLQHTSTMIYETAERRGPRRIYTAHLPKL